MRRTFERWLAIATAVLVGATMLAATATPAAAAAAPTIAVYPTTTLADGQRVLLIGNGFDPAARVSAQECTSENYGCVDLPFSGSVRADGVLVGATTVVRGLSYDGGPNDCAVYHCGLWVSQPTVGRAFTWLHFTPGRVTITPSANLREGQAVTVVGTNLIPGQQVGLAECQGPGGLCTRRLDAAGTTVVGPDGTVRLRTVPTRFLPDYMERDDLYDCAVYPCSLAINLNSGVWEDGYESVAWTPVPFAPTPAVGANSATDLEGSAGTRPVALTFTSVVGASAPRVVQYRTRPGSASAGSDYVPATGTVIVPAGVTRGQVIVAVQGDVTAEPDETFFVELREIWPARSRATLVPVTLVNDDLGLTGALTGRYSADLDHSGTHTVGDEVTWTATVTNTGTTPSAKDVQLTVWLCSTFTGVVPSVWTASSWTTTRGTTSTVTAPDSCPGITATIGTLAPGATVTLTVKSALAQVPPLTIPAAIAHADFSGSNAGHSSVPGAIPGAVIVN